MEKECQVNELGGYSQCYVENSCSVCAQEAEYLKHLEGLNEKNGKDKR